MQADSRIPPLQFFVPCLATIRGLSHDFYQRLSLHFAPTGQQVQRRGMITKTRTEKIKNKNKIAHPMGYLQLWAAPHDPLCQCQWIYITADGTRIQADGATQEKDSERMTSCGYVHVGAGTLLEVSECAFHKEFSKE